MAHITSMIRIKGNVDCVLQKWKRNLLSSVHSEMSQWSRLGWMHIQNSFKNFYLVYYYAMNTYGVNNICTVHVVFMERVRRLPI